MTGPDLAPGEEPRRGVPAATYRLQVHADFTLADAAEVADSEVASRGGEFGLSPRVSL